jgi:hypothetical protein
MMVRPVMRTDQAGHLAPQALSPRLLTPRRAHVSARTRSAVAAEDQRKVAARQHRPEPVGQLAERRGRLAGVLGQRVLPVGFPYLNRQVPLVTHLKPRREELGGQASRAQRRGRQVLADRVAGRAARHAHD